MYCYQITVTPVSDGKHKEGKGKRITIPSYYIKYESDIISTQYCIEVHYAGELFCQFQLATLPNSSVHISNLQSEYITTHWKDDNMEEDGILHFFGLMTSFETFPNMFTDEKMRITGEACFNKNSICTCESIIKTSDKSQTVLRIFQYDHYEKIVEMIHIIRNIMEAFIHL